MNRKNFIKKIALGTTVLSSASLTTLASNVNHIPFTPVIEELASNVNVDLYFLEDVSTYLEYLNRDISEFQLFLNKPDRECLKKDFLQDQRILIKRLSNKNYSNFNIKSVQTICGLININNSDKDYSYFLSGKDELIVSDKIFDEMKTLYSLPYEEGGFYSEENAPKFPC